MQGKSVIKVRFDYKSRNTGWHVPGYKIITQQQIHPEFSLRYSEGKRSNLKRFDVPTKLLNKSIINNPPIKNESAERRFQHWPKWRNKISIILFKPKSLNEHELHHFSNTKNPQLTSIPKRNIQISQLQI